LRRLFILPLLLGIALPIIAGDKKVVISTLSNIESATTIASLKTALECRSNLEGPFSEEEKTSIFNSMGISANDIEDPVVDLLTTEFKKNISADCRSINKIEAGRSLMRISNEYDLRFNPKVEQRATIEIEQFSSAATIMAVHQCGYEKGIYKTKKESTDAIGLAFKEEDIPLSTGINQQVIFATLAIKEYLNNDCTNFNDPNEKVGEIIYNYFQEQ